MDRSVGDIFVVSKRECRWNAGDSTIDLATRDLLRAVRRALALAESLRRYPYDVVIAVRRFEPDRETGSRPDVPVLVLHAGLGGVWTLWNCHETKAVYIHEARKRFCNPYVFAEIGE